MDVQAENDPTPSEQTHTVANGQVVTPQPDEARPSNGQRQSQPDQTMPRFKRRVTPSTFKLDETPEEQEARIRDQLEALDHLRATQSDVSDEEAKSWDEVMAAINRDPAFSVVPPDFILHETDELRDARIQRTRAGLAALWQGDPEEHRQTIEALQEALDEVPPSQRMKLEGE